MDKRGKRGKAGKPMLALGLGLWAFVAGCGSAESPEPLVASTLSGQYEGTAFTPVNGFATLYKNQNLIAFGDGPLNCDSPTLTSPPSGINAVFAIPAMETGSYSSVLVMIHYNKGGHYEASGANAGLVTISSVTDGSVGGAISYSRTDEQGLTSGVSGNFEVVRCP
jgi:hypothetical protein